MTDDELLSAYRSAIEEAKTAPRAGFGGFSQNAVFSPASKAVELHAEVKRRATLEASMGEDGYDEWCGGGTWVTDTKSEMDEAKEDFDREHRCAQAALQRKRPKMPPGKTMRYEDVYDSSEECMCDKVWIDRLTGSEVMRYDAADPANTNSYYGARPDEESFIHRGLNIYELIDVEKAKPLPRFPVYYHGDDFE